jgi:tRNA-Thr(GGU) m(6)t(6)A37 methyltransferase TsaA
MQHLICPIGKIHTPYKEKFAVPRQANLVPSASAKIELIGEANCEESIRGLTQFSHLWLLFLFDQHLDKGWSPTVRPPRLGGNERIGVFASRASFRPNGIGMSAVPLLGITKENGSFFIQVGNCDLVDKTPIIDIKPYIHYSDAISDAVSGYANTIPNTLEVCFSDKAMAHIKTLQLSANQIQVIKEVLAQDPRPAYKKGKTDLKEYAVHLFDFNVKFHVDLINVRVSAIELI